MNNLLKIFVLFSCFLTTVLAQFDPESLLPSTSETTQKQAVVDLIKRVIGEEHAQKFVVDINKKRPFRSFELSSNDGTVLIAASDGTSAAKGFHHYLKYYLHKDLSWNRVKIVLPKKLEFPKVNISSKSASSFLYHQNVCTWSYSFPWWTWKEWERHIDWMAMMGISLSIAPIQEHIWYQLFSEMGISKNEILDHFNGPAFLAWSRMGNVHHWIDSVSLHFLETQKKLQQKIIEAQRNLGMTIAIPAFAGFVPNAFEHIYPDVNFTRTGRWNNFADENCCTLFLDPNTPLFQEIAKKYLERVIDAYGTNHIYFADPFNEVQPRLADASYLNMTAYHIFESIRQVDSKAVWLLQGWMFVKNIFWTDDLIKSFLTAVPQGRLLVLDLQSEQFPQYERTHSFHGQPFIWCMLHNFGGTLGMHGSVEIVNTNIRLAREMSNSSMVGVGITPEGINQNYVMYALALERGWEQHDFDVYKWFNDYADTHYGVSDERLRGAWQLLRQSVYAYKGLKKIRGKYAVTRRPTLNLETWTWYNGSMVHQAWLLLLAAHETLPYRDYIYEHDLVDVTRQFLQIQGDRLYVNLIAAYKNKNLNQLTYIADKMLRLFMDMEEILATHKNFLLGSWLLNAIQMSEEGVTDEALSLLRNARFQVTTWGLGDSPLVDYATKQWAGIVKDYYWPRWSLFLEMLTESVKTKKPFNKSEFMKIIIKTDSAFAENYTVGPRAPSGVSSYDLSQEIFSYWTSLLHSSAYLSNVPLHVRMLSNTNESESITKNESDPNKEDF